MRACENCTFYAPATSETGQCRRNPPKVFILKAVHGDVATSQQPIVGREYWCGHFTAMPPVPETSPAAQQ